MKNAEISGKSQGKNLSRRAFVKSAALTAAAFTIVPRHVLGGKGYIAPSDKLNIACIGIGGMGKANLKNVAPTENIVALCDIDEVYAAPVFELYPKAKRHKDYRRMLESQKDIDAVIIATPDHQHAIQTATAMKLGKHVYVQKPLTYTVYEARELAKMARQMPKIVTQMGNQGHSLDESRSLVEWIQDGAIGNIPHVDVWTNRPIWPQGISRPTDAPAVPATLDWDLFLGPAPQRDYNPAYTPFKWRGWVDYGVGALGDMGAHLIDHIVWSLKLGAPVSIEATSSPFGKSKNAAGKEVLETYPLATVVHYDFAAREQLPAMRMTWYDGGLMPPKPEELGDEALNRTGGVLYYGSKGKLMHETYGANPRLLPKSLMESYKKPAQKLPRIGMSHEMNWVAACKGKAKASCPFDYAGPLTETMILGVLALRAPGRKLLWDSANMQFTNAPELNAFIRREYRQGWIL
jgi:predicted dehydrogenase